MSKKLNHKKESISDKSDLNKNPKIIYELDSIIDPIIYQVNSPKIDKKRRLGLKKSKLRNINSVIAGVYSNTYNKTVGLEISKESIPHRESKINSTSLTYQNSLNHTKSLSRTRLIPLIDTNNTSSVQIDSNDKIILSANLNRIAQIHMLPCKLPAFSKKNRLIFGKTKLQKLKSWNLVEKTYPNFPQLYKN